MKSIIATALLVGLSTQFFMPIPIKGGIRSVRVAEDWPSVVFPFNFEQESSLYTYNETT